MAAVTLTELLGGAARAADEAGRARRLAHLQQAGAAAVAVA